MTITRPAIVLALAAVGSLIAPSVYAQGTVIYVVPSQPINLFGMYGVPWTQDFDIDGDGIQDYQFDNDGAAFYVSPLGSNRQVAYPAVGRDMGSDLTPLFAGEVVGSSLDPLLGQWVDRSSPNLGWHSSMHYQFDFGGGGTFYRKIAYMGIDFMAADGDHHYGWIKIDTSLHLTGGLLVEWAWAATPGESIAAGQVPEPSTCTLLTVGGMALLLLRRQGIP